MSCNKYLTELNSDKPTKRVRFSQKAQNVYEYDCGEGRSNMEDEVNTLSSELKYSNQDELPTNESMGMSFSKSTDTVDTDQYLYVGELTECNKQVDITDSSCEAKSYPQPSESSFAKDDHTHPQSADYFNNNNSDMADLNLLISGTEHMAISVPDQVQEANQHLTDTLEMSPSDSGPAKDILQAAVQAIEQDEILETRERSSVGMMIDRQTSKINSCLSIGDDKVDSAVDLKDAFSDTWNKAKFETIKIDFAALVQQAKEQPVAFSGTWNKAKFENIKINFGTNVQEAKEKPVAFSGAWNKAKYHNMKTDFGGNVQEAKEQPLAFSGAWNKAKYENIKIDFAANVQGGEKPVVAKLVAYQRRFDYATDRNHGRIMRRVGIETTEAQLKQNIQKEVDEIKMVYGAWKTRKQLLLCNDNDKHLKKMKKRRFDHLMNERMGKKTSDASSLK